MTRLLASLVRAVFELRPYQRDCLHSILTAYKQGRRRVLVSLPTGTGKTVTATGLSLGGIDAANYTLDAATATDLANITAKSVTPVSTPKSRLRLQVAPPSTLL